MSIGSVNDTGPAFDKVAYRVLLTLLSCCYLTKLMNRVVNSWQAPQLCGKNNQRFKKMSNPNEDDDEVFALLHELRGFL